MPVTYVFVILVTLGTSIATLFLGGYRIKGGEIKTTTPFLFGFFQESKRYNLRRPLPLKDEEEEMRRWYRATAVLILLMPVF